MAARMSPKQQAEARAKAREEFKAVETGDAQMDSLLTSEVAKRQAFGGMERARLAAKADTTKKEGIMSKIGNLFKPRAKK